MELNGRERRRRRNGLFPSSNNKEEVVVLCGACVVFFSVCALLSTVCNAKACFETRSSSTDYFHIQGPKSRRQLIAGGPGSFPPRCSNKCGACTPCFPVHIPVPPSTPVIAEYYPEAWRCKCGNKLYMP